MPVDHYLFFLLYEMISQNAVYKKIRDENFINLFFAKEHSKVRHTKILRVTDTQFLFGPKYELTIRHIPHPEEVVVPQ